MYFDRIERSDVEGTISSLYEHVKTLEDIQFFIKYASILLPPLPSSATGALIFSNILQLQDQLTNKRKVH